MNEISKLKLLRLKHGLTQQQIAEKLYCDRITFWRWENNKQVPRPVFQKGIQELIGELEKQAHKN